jgi:1-phosphatidylinositol-4-phosphate 5-kinase
MECDDISPQNVMDSLSILKNYRMVFRAGEGSGASGSFFFFSYDNRFLIKTLQGDEKKKLLSMLDGYVDHIKKTKNKSLIARIYGIFTF